MAEQKPNDNGSAWTPIGTDKDALDWITKDFSGGTTDAKGKQFIDQGGSYNNPAGSSGAGQFDWRAYLSDWGFPPDVVSELDRIFKSYADPNQAGAAALAYVRGTDWYHTTFAGIQEGIKNGVVGNEADYRSYVNQLNQMYQRYYGRNVTTQEVADFLKQGKGLNQVGGHLQGEAYIKANGQELQYELGAFDAQGQATKGELSDYGDEYGGLDNTTGAAVQQRIALAHQKLQRIFQGTLATPSLSVLGGSGRLAASSLGGTNSTDVAA